MLISEIISLTKWMNNSNNVPFGDEKSFLWRLYDDSLKMNIKMNEAKIKEEIDMVKNEIDYLTYNPKFGIWSTDYYIDLLKEKVIFTYQQKLEDLISSNKEKKIKSQLTQLLKKVKDTNPNKEGHKKFKKSFISAIEKIIDNNPTEESLNKCQMNYNDYIKLVSNTNSNYSKENFNWPFKPDKTISQNLYTKPIKLYQHILWYSQASSIIKRIIEQNDKNTIKNISDLCEIQELISISSFLINKICKNSNSNEKKISDQDLDILQSSLDAHFICKLFNDDLFDQIGNLDTILNDLENRRSEDSEMKWINQNANKYPLDLQIVLPHFLPNDIFSLFVCYENDSTPSCGPFLKINKMLNQSLADSLVRFLQKKTTIDKTKFTKYSVLVCIEIYHCNIDKSLELTRDFDEFKSFIQKELESSKSNKKKENVLNKIISILQIGESLSRCPQFTFSFNDTLFLRKNWINDEVFVNKYPSLLYWLSSNEYCKEQLQHNFGNYEFSSQKLPFWLFTVRIMSSLKCIEFHCQSQTRIGQLIKNTINKSTLSFEYDFFNIKNQKSQRISNEIHHLIDEYNLIFNKLMEEIDGALVFWAEGEPLFYQVNIFLEQNGFDFKIKGNHQGRQILLPDESNDLQNRQTFNRHPQGDETNVRSTLAHNLGKIFEGVTISYANYDLNKIKPFIPFSRDSEGGISSMFLPSDKNKGTGDIVIDYGYTKCFANLTEDGTYRYIQNIAGWTMNMESHIAAGYSPKEWRPRAINYKINLFASWEFPMAQRNADVDIIFIIDATGSMRAWLLAAKNKARTIANVSRSKYPNISFNFGAIFYKDPVVQWRDRNVYYDPTSNIDSLVYFMSMQRADGCGGDGPEDWAGAYDILLHQIRFRPGSTRAVIHIADSEAHGSEWGGKHGVYESEGPRLTNYIRTCARSNY